VCFIIFQASALSIKETYGHLNLLINASGILSIPEVLQPGKYLFHRLVIDIYVSYKYVLVNDISYLYCTETTLNKLEKPSLMLAYEVNAVGPILVIKVTSI
jgi:hypothetical protein